jgi:hypothetical protein
VSGPWSLPVTLAEVDRGGVRLSPSPDADTRARIAEMIGVDALDAYQADVRIEPWLDGAELKASFTAEVVQTCGISLDPFASTLQGEFSVRVLPAGSRHAPGPESREVAVDPEAEDPPDVLEGDVIDVGAYLVEYLALEVDPFPRKPDAVYEPPETQDRLSPFAALAVLKDKRSD